LPHSGLRGATYPTHKPKIANKPQVTTPKKTLATVLWVVYALHEAYLRFGDIFREVQRPLAIAAELLLRELNVALLSGGGQLRRI
jgi:hypothetical protein